MSDTTQGAAATAPASTGGFAPWTMLSGFFKAVEAGAASIYHRLLSAESVVQNWTASNPIVAPLVTEGVSYATGVLSKVGVPVQQIEVAGEDVLTAVKGLAALDPTVPSIAAPSSQSSNGAAQPAQPQPAALQPDAPTPAQPVPQAGA